MVRRLHLAGVLLLALPQVTCEDSNSNNEVSQGGSTGESSLGTFGESSASTNSVTTYTPTGTAESTDSTGPASTTSMGVTSEESGSTSVGDEEMCPDGGLLCDAECIDPKSNPKYCGARGSCAGLERGEQCSTKENCHQGECVTSCSQEQVRCDGRCVDPMTDPRYCGAQENCVDGQRCHITTGEVCEAGTCVKVCRPPGRLQCDGECISPSADINHCGAKGDCKGPNAGEVCSFPEICLGGVCGLHCPLGLIECEQMCIDPRSHPSYCGADLNCEGGDVCEELERCKDGACVEAWCKWKSFYIQLPTPDRRLVFDPSADMQSPWAAQTTRHSPGREALIPNTQAERMATFAVMLAELDDCEIVVPEEPESPDFVYVHHSNGKRYKQILGRDPDGDFIHYDSCSAAAADGYTEGWVSKGPAPNAFELELCGPLCDDFKSLRVIEVIFGCPTSGGTP